VYTLAELSADSLRTIIERALQTDVQLAKRHITVTDWDALLALSGGDARSALNTLEAAVLLAPTTDEPITIDRALLATAVQRKVVAYDRAGDHHYDTISAMIKSLRGSDPDAAMLYLALMIEAGEDPTFIARRLIIFASEDIGNADPHALQLAVSVFQAVERIGMPEGRLPLAQAVTYLASAPKSNASYLAIDQARGLVQQTGSVSIPLHLRNAPTALMKELGHGSAYQYPHDAPDHFVTVNYFPDGVTPTAFYRPDGQGREHHVRERLRALWPERYDQHEP
jgi:putative ATPase